MIYHEHTHDTHIHSKRLNGNSNSQTAAATAKKATTKLNGILCKINKQSSSSSSSEMRNAKCQVSVPKKEHKQTNVYVCGQSGQNQHGCENITNTQTHTDNDLHRHEKHTRTQARRESAHKGRQ